MWWVCRPKIFKNIRTNYTLKYSSPYSWGENGGCYSLENRNNLVSICGDYVEGVLEEKPAKINICVSDKNTKEKGWKKAKTVGYDDFQVSGEEIDVNYSVISFVKHKYNGQIWFKITK